MNELKLNETPVRTSRNFNINNIKIKDIEIPTKITEFQGTSIVRTNEDIVITENVSSCNLKYGIGKELIDEIMEKANKKIKIEIQGRTKQSVEIENNFDEENINLIENIEIVPEEETVSNIVIKYKSEEPQENYHNGVIKVFAKKNSKTNITIVNFLNLKSNNFLSIENNIEEGAEVNYTIVDFGGKNSITNYYSNLSRHKVKK